MSATDIILVMNAAFAGVLLLMRQRDKKKLDEHDAQLIESATDRERIRQEAIAVEHSLKTMAQIATNKAETALLVAAAVVRGTDEERARAAKVLEETAKRYTMPTSQNVG